jgi:hypothetical protein
VQTARIVFLNDKTRRAFDFFRQRFAPGRLSCPLEVAFPFVFRQTHSAKLTTDCADSIDFKALDRHPADVRKEIAKRKNASTSWMRFE